MNRVRLFLENRIVGREKDKPHQESTRPSTSRPRLVRICSITALLFVGFLLLSPDTAKATARSSNGTGGGSWNATGTWAGGVIPVDGDSVTIVTGDAVTVNVATASLIGLTINGTLTVQQNVNVNSGIANLTVNGSLNYNNNTNRTITVTGNLTVASGATFNTANPGGAHSHVLSLGGNLTNNGTLNCINGDDVINFTFNGTSAQSISGTSAIAFNSVTISNTAAAVSSTVNFNVSGTMTVNASTKFSPGATVVINSGGAAGTITGSGTVQVTRIVSVADYNNQYLFSTDTLSGMTVDYAGAGAQTINAFTYGSLLTSGSGTKTMSGATTVNTACTIGSGTTLDEAAITMTLPGGAMLTVNGTLSFSSSTGLIRSGTTGTTTLTMGSGGVIQTADDSGLGPATGASLQTQTGGAWDTSSISTNGTVEYNRNATSAQTVTDRDYNNLTITGSTQTKTWALGGTRTLNGTLTINASAPLTVTGTQTLNVKGDWSNGGTYTKGTETVSFSGTAAAQAIGGANATSFTNLTIANTSATVSANTNINVSSTMTVNPSAVFSPAAAVVLNTSGAAGTITGSGTIQVTRIAATADYVNQYKFSTNTLTSMTVDYTGAGPQTIDSTVGNYGALKTTTSNTKTLGGNVTVNGGVTIGSGTTLDVSGSNFAMNVGGDWTNNGGTFTPQGGTVTFNSTTGAQAIAGSAISQTFNKLTVNKSGQTLSVSGSTTTLTLNSDLTITAGTLAAGTATAINIAGNWSNSGNYTKASETVTFNGSGAQITGSQPTIFNNLTVGHANGVTINTTGSFDTTVDGVLALTSGDVTTGTHTLAMGSGATSTGNGDVVGTVSRNDLNGMVTRSFGNPNVQITETVGTVTSFTVNLVKGTSSLQTAVKREYVLTPNGGTNFAATVRLHYLDSELPSGANEATLQLWRETGTTWTVQGATSHLDDGAGDANWVELTGVTLFSPWAIAGPGAPTACKLESFAASRSADGVVLEWRTGYEVNNVGFNIYKQDQSGNMVRLTPNPVAGSALMVRRGTPLTAGLSYSWTDPETKSGETPRYWLEDIDASGQNVWNGPFWIDETGKPSRPPSPGGGRSVTINSMNAQVAKEIASSAKGFQYEPVAQMETKAKPGKLKGSDLTQQLDLAGNPAVKISVRQEGWYRVNQPDLVAAGLDASVDPHNLQLYVDGQQIPMIVKGEDDGKFDPQDSIEFYGLGLDTSSTDIRVYWLIAGQEQGDRIKPFKGSPKGSAASGFQYTVQRKDRLFYFSNIPNGDRENFFGAFIYNQATDQTLNVPHIAPAANATLEVAMQGFNAGPHTVAVSVNGTLVGTLNFNDQAYSISTLTFAQSLLTEGTNTVTMVAQAGSSDFSFVDYMRLTYLHSYDADNNALKITAGAAQSVAVNGFSDPAIRVIDVTDATTPKEMLGRVSQTPQGYSVLLATSGGTGSRTLLVFADSQVKSAAKVAANGLSSLRQPLNSADLLVVSYGAFSSSLQSLVSLRESQGLRTQLVDIEDVYDEFNAGSKSPQALKDFLSYAHTNWKKRPRYVLLAGSASFDPRNYLGLGDTDFVPTMFVQTEHIETASDDALADFNNDGIPEIAVGRLPALTAQEATTMVNKVVGYDQGAKGEGVLLVADINDGFDFEGADDQLRSLVPAGTNVQEIRRSSDPQAEQDLLNALNQGKGLVNYVGHGSVNLWRANLLVSTDGASLTNTQRLSIFVAMTCLNGYFIDQRSESLAHALMNSPGGAAAVWSSSGLTEPDAQALANQELFRQIFNGASARLGDATIKAKAAISDLDVRRTWILIGDPTTRLK